MNTLTIAICEDNKDELNHLLKILKSNNTISTVCKTFSNGEDFLKNYAPNIYDLIFMDIYMPGISGIDVVKSIRQKDPHALIAFTTTSIDFTLESYRLDIIKYLEKPIKKEKIYDLLNLAYLKMTNKPGFSFKIDNKNITIPYNQIIFLEQQGRNTLIHATSNRIYQLKDKLDKYEKQFITQSFIRCHKSYLVNLNYVKSLDKELSVFIMSEGGNVHIRRESMSSAKKAYEDHLFKKTREQTHENY